MRRIIPLLLVAALVPLLASLRPAAAKAKTVDDLLKAAAAAVGENKHDRAATWFGKAVRRAHDMNDLLAESRADIALTKFIRSHQTEKGFRLLLVLLVKELRPDHPGALVSAPALAREILISAVRDGDRTGVPEAAEVLTKFAKKRKRGRAAKAMASFGQGLAILAAAEPSEEDRKKAATLLQAALGACVEARWYETATTVATELAVLQLALKEPEAARDALEQARKAHDGYADPVAQSKWIHTADRRLKGAPEEVMAPIRAAEEEYRKRPPHAAGKGDAGTSAAAKLGPVWDRMKAKQEVVTVRRTAKGADVRLPWLKGTEPSWNAQSGQHFLKVDGIALAFHNRAVALESISLNRLATAPGVSPVRTRYRAWYLLAPGETWSVTKGGVVAIREASKR